jgi:S1-C subfamily serine protease
MLTAGLTRTAPIAVPSATIDRVVAELLEHGRVAQGYLGIGLQTIPLPAAFARLLKREQRAGVIVLNVEPDGPAEGSGIVVGDVMVEIDGQPISDTDDIHTALRSGIGKTLPAIVVRGGERVELKVRVGERRK